MFETEKLWDDVYDRFHRAGTSRLSVWNETPTPFFTRLIPFLQHRGAKVVVDAGCGDGKNIGPLLEAGFRVIGVDVSQAALRYCRRRFKNKKNLTGERLSPNEFSHNGFYLRYDTPKTIEKMLRRFSILCFTSESHFDPPHGPGYVRRAKHQHHSYFVLARKEPRV